MKTQHTCPKCGCERLVNVQEVADQSYANDEAVVKTAHLVRRALPAKGWGDTAHTSSDGELSAFACRGCGFVETYLKSPETLDAEGTGTEPVEGPGATYSDRERIALLELQLEALIRLLEHRTGITTEELQLMVSRVDLEDGVEDGIRGPNRRSKAPTCPSCGHPVNPHRNQCVYCYASIDVQPLVETPSISGIPCSICGADTPKRDIEFSEHGMVCPSCYAK